MAYETAQIRQLLKDAFSDEELTTLCFDHFRDVYESFSAGMTKTQKIQLLIENCQRRDLLSYLAATLQRERPDQYVRSFSIEMDVVTANDISAQSTVVAGDDGTSLERMAETGVSTSGGGTRPPPSSTQASEPIPTSPQSDAASPPAKSKRPIEYIAIAGLIVGFFACLAAWLVVPEVRQFLGLVGPTPTITPPIAIVGTHTPTASSTATFSATATSTHTPTPSSTPTPPIRALIESEAEAVLARDINLIRSIFAPDAVRINAETGQTRNAYEAYAEMFSTLSFSRAAHGRINVTLTDNIEAAESDSCGSFRVISTGANVDFGGPQSDRWIFRQNANGEWQISSLTINVPPAEPQQKYTFEDNTHDCWLVRIDDSVPQGLTTIPTRENAHEGQTALRFDFDTALTKEHRAQVVHINLPFAGQAAAWLYAPADAPADLEAGFFAMELDHAPWKYHAPDQLFPLTPGRWTPITWRTDVTGWAQPPNLLGIEIRRSGGGDQRGYVLIDDITTTSR